MHYGIYIHHPWCKRRCSYCAFNIYIDPNPPFAEWKKGILKDWSIEKAFFEGPPESIYFGGGTPSLAPTKIILDIISELKPAPEAEISIELNPGDLNMSQLLELKRGGIERYSVGIQSFNPRFAKLLNRSHTVHENHRLLDLFSVLKPSSWSLDHRCTSLTTASASACETFPRSLTGTPTRSI